MCIIYILFYTWFSFWFLTFIFNYILRFALYYQFIGILFIILAAYGWYIFVYVAPECNEMCPLYVGRTDTDGDTYEEFCNEGIISH